MNTGTLRVVHPPRIFAVIQPGAVLRDPETGRTHFVVEIAQAGAWVADEWDPRGFQDFLTADAVNSMELVRNGEPPKGAA